MDIKVLEDNILNISEQIRNQSELIKDICKSLETTTKSLGSSWQGSNYISFTSKVLFDDNSYVQELQRFSKELEAFSLYLEQSVSLYNKVDSVYSSKKIIL